MGIPYQKINEIAGHIRQARRVSFITGAGASRAAGIPSAAGLVDIITRDYPHCLTTLPLSERTSYGPVMARLSPADREKLIQPLLDNARLNWGQVALAGMMQNRTVTRVLTFNFDLVLERAAALIGLQVPVYDFGVAPTHEINRIAPTAIIHLHGQSSGLVLLNTAAETDRHAKALHPLLQDTLCNGLTVIGYSGAADGAFKVMAECYNSYHRLIWLGHSEDPPAHLRSLLDKDYAEYVGGCDFDLVMIELARQLGHWPPMIFRNPMEHVLTGLSEVIDYPVADEKGLDVLTPTRERLKEFSARWVAGGGREETVVQSLLSGEQDASAPGNNNPASDLVKRMAAWNEVSIADRLANGAKELEGAEAEDAFAKAYAHYSRALDIKPDIHEALTNWGSALQDEAQTLEGDAALTKFAEAALCLTRAVKIKPDDHISIFNLGSVLDSEARLLDGDLAKAKFAQARQNYARAVEVKPEMHEALTNWGAVLMLEARLLEGDAARKKLMEASQKFADALRVRPETHEALDNWGSALGDLSHLLSEPERSEVLAEATSKLLRAQEITGRLTYNLACAFAMQGQAEAAVAVMEACVRNGTLPKAAHLDADRDLDLIRDDAGYLAFRVKLG